MKRFVFDLWIHVLVFAFSFGSCFGQKTTSINPCSSDLCAQTTAEEEVETETTEEGEDDSPFAVGLERSDGVVPNLFLPERSASQAMNWSGFLESNQDGQYRIGAKFTGHLTVELNGQVLIDAHSNATPTVLSEPIELEFDNHILRVRLKPIDDRIALTMFWSGPGFLLEPIPRRALFHNRNSDATLATTTESRVAQMFRYLRCEACHELPDSDALPLRSPSLHGVVQQTKSGWLEEFFTRQDEDSNSGSPLLRNLHQVFTSDEARDLVAWLGSLSLDEEQAGSEQKGKEQNRPKPALQPSSGRVLFHSIGCLACHKYDGVGSDGLFAGGDLTNISRKRPVSFLEAWLRDPADINPQHRMPKFELTDEQIEGISAFLASSGNERPIDTDRATGDLKRGQELSAEHRCLSCHESQLDPSTADQQLPRTKLLANSDWEQSCIVSSDGSRPDYSFLGMADRKALSDYAKKLAAGKIVFNHVSHIQENNCLACHERDRHPGLTPTILSTIKAVPGLSSQTAAMKPPALNSVGDKLKDRVLRNVITRQQSPRRTWLTVQMPKFPLNEKEVRSITTSLIAEDRVPTELSRRVRATAATDAEQPVGSLDLTMGARLVTSDGFGCTSCHAIGKVSPPKSTPANQLGPSLTRPEEHIRRTWFDRWVRNPSRITPKMEMPSVQIAVPGVLDGKLDRQLTAVWHTLNQRRFNPPDPSPTRVVSLPHDATEAVVLTDVMQVNGRKLIKPFLIGLPNRQNVLLDLATSRVAAVWAGDVALQRTQGKTWFWEPPTLQVDETKDVPDLILVRDGQTISSKPTGQFMTEPDSWRQIPGGVELQHRLFFDDSESAEGRVLQVIQRWRARDEHIQRDVEVRGLRKNESIRMRSELAQTDPTSIPLIQVKSNERYFLARANDKGIAKLHAEYSAGEPLPSRFRQKPPALRSAKTLDVMPGFRVQQLPLREDVMPISLAWRPNGDMVVGSLKGKVWIATDEDGDGLEDSIAPIGDDLAAPYGLHAEANYIDALTKYGLIRLHLDAQNKVVRHEVVASGWGHTDDYHDWVVGLPRDANGNYFVSVPCQQDDRTAEAARYRGTVLKLVPSEATDTNPRQFRLEQISSGHRFPMGIARNKRGQVYVTDNQGNWNPYNELNHVHPGAHFGFINKLDRHDGYNPELTPPAINIPHPWTRSVNGICFLELPLKSQAEKVKETFGPFEGHLLGCEYDTRRLIRMTIEEVDGVMQGAAYPFAESATDPADSLQGPINCAVAPDGAIYVANIRDSGWGGANNTGSIVRITSDFAKLPAGIREVTALPTGFRIHFTRPVARRLALDAANYKVSSVRRVSTPVYGGDDMDRRSESVTPENFDAANMSVDLQLEQLRSGFVYEFRLKSLVEAGEFYPAEAFYSLYRIPPSPKQ